MPVPNQPGFSLDCVGGSLDALFVGVGVSEEDGESPPDVPEPVSLVPEPELEPLSVVPEPEPLSVVPEPEPLSVVPELEPLPVDPEPGSVFPDESGELLG